MISQGAKLELLRLDIYICALLGWLSSLKYHEIIYNWKMVPQN